MGRCGVTTFCAPPTVWRMLVQEDLAAHLVPTLREVVGAGEPLNPEVIDRVRQLWGKTVRDGYGQTETTAQIGNPPGAPLKPGSMGRPLPGYTIALLDPVTSEAGTEGEISIDLSARPTALMVGYRDDKTLTDEVMRGGYYHTGDVAQRDDEGYITYVGRSDDVFKASDYRISPFELDEDERGAGELQLARRLAQEHDPEHDRADGLDGEDHRGERRGQARQRDRDQQPAEHLGAERERGQPGGGRPRGREVVHAEREPDRERDGGGHGGRIAQRPGRPAQVLVAVAQDEQEAGVRDPGQDAEEHAARRVGAVGVRLEHARDEHDAQQDEGQRGEDPPARRLVQDGPRGEGDDHDLEVAEHRRQARADVVDRLVPEDQVGREEDPGDEREALLAGRARAVAPALPPGERGEHRQGVGAAIERGGDRMHGRLPDEDGREGDGQRAGEGDERRPAERRRRGDDGPAHASAGRPKQAVPSGRNPSRP